MGQIISPAVHPGNVVSSPLMSASQPFDDLLLVRRGGPRMTMGEGPTWLAPVDQPEEWHAKAEALRAVYRRELGRKPDGYDDVALDLRVESQTQRDGYVHRIVSYMVGPGERITAHVLIPSGGSGPFPAVLTLHPTTELGKDNTIGQDPDPTKRDWAYGLHLVQRGYVTLSFDQLSCNSRMYPGAQRTYSNEPFYDRFPEWSARGKDIHDVSRAVDVLEQTPEVDASRIGSIGHSQGGGLTTDAMPLEPRIKVGVNNCGDWPYRLSMNPFNRARTGWWIGNAQLRPLLQAGKLPNIDLHEKLAMIAPRPLLFIQALDDFGHKPEDADRLHPGFENLARNVAAVYALLGAADRFQTYFHVKGHAFAAPERELAYRFLDRHLLNHA